MKIAMTLKVRDEADIIADNIRFHAAQGVELFIVADHGSTDGTAELLNDYREAGLVHLVPIEGDDVFDVALRNMTLLAKLAHELGADWVIHNDADEFWWSVVGDLKDAFAMVSDDYGLMLAPRAELPAVDGSGPWTERMRFREVRALHRPKIAHRAIDGVRLHGAHPSTLWVEGEGRPIAGSMKMRGPADGPVSAELGGLVLAPVHPIRVLHAPVRSYEQYASRVEIALQSDAWGKRGEFIREQRDQGRLPELYRRLSLDRPRIDELIASGHLVEDRSFSHYLADCPDPLSDSPAPSGAGAAGPEAQQAELDRLQHDAMFAISRRFQQVARESRRRKSRKIRQRRKLAAEQVALAAPPEREAGRSSRWRGLGRRRRQSAG